MGSSATPLQIIDLKIDYSTNNQRSREANHRGKEAVTSSLPTFVGCLLISTRRHPPWAASLAVNFLKYIYLKSEGEPKAPLGQLIHIYVHIYVNNCPKRAWGLPPSLFKYIYLRNYARCFLFFLQLPATCYLLPCYLRGGAAHPEGCSPQLVFLSFSIYINIYEKERKASWPPLFFFWLCEGYITYIYVRYVQPLPAQLNFYNKYIYIYYKKFSWACFRSMIWSLGMRKLRLPSYYDGSTPTASAKMPPLLIYNKLCRKYVGKKKKKERIALIASHSQIKRKKKLAE